VWSSGEQHGNGFPFFVRARRAACP
jgi:hypothetical protein